MKSPVIGHPLAKNGQLFLSALYRMDSPAGRILCRIHTYGAIPPRKPGWRSKICPFFALPAPEKADLPPPKWAAASPPSQKRGAGPGGGGPEKRGENLPRLQAGRFCPGKAVCQKSENLMCNLHKPYLIKLWILYRCHRKSCPFFAKGCTIIGDFIDKGIPGGL